MASAISDQNCNRALKQLREGDITFCRKQNSFKKQLIQCKKTVDNASKLWYYNGVSRGITL